MKRRAFLYTGCVGLTYVSFLRGCDSLETPRMLPDGVPDLNTDARLRPYLLATAEGKDLISDSKRTRVVLNLPFLYTYSKTVSVGGEIDNSKVTDILTRSQPINRDSLVSMPEYFGFLENPERYGHAVGVALGVGAALAAPLSPVAGIVLGVAAVVGEDAWNVVSTGGNLSTDLPDRIIYGSPSETDYINRACLEATVAGSNSTGTFGVITTGSTVKIHTGIDFAQDSNALITKLPEALKTVIIEAVNESTKDLQNDLTAQNAALDKVLDRFSGQLAEFQQQSKQFKEILQIEADREKRERARAQWAALQSDINSGINIATFLLGKAMGDPRKAKEIGRTLSGIANVGMALLTGNYLGAISSCLSLFGGGADSMQPVMEQLEKLGKQIDQLRTEMHERFDRLEQQQQQMLVALARIYQQVKDGFDITNQRLQEFRDEFNSYRLAEEEDKINDSVTALRKASEEAKLLVDAKQPGWENEYIQKLPTLAAFARSEARKSYYRGNFVFSEGELTKDVSLRKNADRLIDWVPFICNSIGVGAPQDLVNPFAAELGIEAYLQADLLLGSVVNSEREKVLLRMWEDAINCRTALNAVSSVTTLKKLAHLTSSHAGLDVEPDKAPSSSLVGAVRLFEQRWVKETLKPYYSAEKLPSQPLFSKPRAELVYGMFSDHRVSESPVDLVLKLGLIKLTEVSHETKEFFATGKVERWNYHLEITKGPHTGTKIGEGDQGYTKESYLDHSPGERRFYNPPASYIIENGKAINKKPNVIGDDIDGNATIRFLNYCEFLLGYYYATEILPLFPGWLHEKGFDGLIIKRWSDAACGLRIAAAVHLWRSFDGFELEGQTDVRNILLLSTTSEAKNWLDQLINQSKEAYVNTASTYQKENDPRNLNLHMAVRNRTKTDIDELLTLSEIPLSKSVPVVDRVLQKLGGYLTAHNVKFQVPVLSA